MAAGRSFADYVKRKCYNGLFSAAENYIRENAGSLDFRTSHVHRVGDLELQDATIERVYVSDLPGMKVAFDVGVELEVLIKEDDYHYDETDIKYPWIRISCEGDLSKALDDWKITNEEMTQEEKEQLIQDEWDKQFNRPEYNNWHKETRHIDPTPKRKRMDGRAGYICADEDDASFDIMDYLNTYDPTEDYSNKFEYEERCKKIHAAVKPAQAEMLIAIILDGMTVAEYAESIGDTANNVSHRYRRAVNNLKKLYKKRPFTVPPVATH